MDGDFAKLKTGEPVEIGFYIVPADLRSADPYDRVQAAYHSSGIMLSDCENYLEDADGSLIALRPFDGMAFYLETPARKGRIVGIDALEACNLIESYFVVRVRNDGYDVDGEEESPHGSSGEIVAFVRRDGTYNAEERTRIEQEVGRLVEKIAA
jgi:hypothetical protein